MRLTVDSELRGDYARSERFPVLCSTEFVFRDSAEISFRYEVSAAALGIPRAELGLRLTGADGKEKILPFQLFVSSGTGRPGDRACNEAVDS